MKILAWIIGCVSVLSFSAQELHWTDINVLKDSMAVKEKPILVKIETPWCGYCKKMDADVFPNKKVSKELRENYYYVKLDAESKYPVKFNDTTYNFVLYNGSKRGIHQLAQKLGTKDGQIKYPTIVILDNQYQVTRLLDGYLNKTSFYYWLRDE